MSSTSVSPVSQSAALVAGVLTTFADTFGPTTPAGQQAEALGQIAEDIGVDAASATGPQAFQTVLQAAIDGDYGRQAAQLFGMQITAADAAEAAVVQYTLKFDGKYKALATPQVAFDAMSADVWGQIRHDCRHKAAGFLTDGEFLFEEVRRAVWVLAHRATYALMFLKDPSVKGQIHNEDLDNTGVAA